MLVGVMSDTHDNLPKLARALSVLQERGVDVILHAGDFVSPFAMKLLVRAGVPIVGVFGNNDGERRGLSAVCDELHESPWRLELDGRSVVLAHDERTLTPQATAGADLVVVGHTHEVEVRQRSPLTVNPGEVCGWLTGRSTVGLVELDAMAAEIIDLGPQETVPI